MQQRLFLLNFKLFKLLEEEKEFEIEVSCVIGIAEYKLVQF